MAAFQPFAYNNTGSPISGATEYGNLSVGYVDVDYSSDYAGVKWWGGPDEDLPRYYIGNSRPGGQPVPPGVVGPGTVGFWGSKFKTDSSFLDIANYVGGKNGQPPFGTVDAAVTWLSNNGFWNSYSGITPTPTSTVVIETPTPTPTVTNTQTPTPTCPFIDCYHYVEFTISGDTSIEWVLCNSSTVTFGYSSGTYPATFIEGPFTEADCFSGNSYTVVSGSTPYSVNYYNACCEELVTPTPTATNEAPTPTPTATPIEETPTPTPTNTNTPTPTDMSSVTTYTISGCTSLSSLIADLGPGALAPGDVFYLEFTGATPSGCYTILNKIDAIPSDGTSPIYFYTSCALCEAANTTPTPTPTITQTLTPSVTQTASATPTNTPTPSTTSIPVTGYGYNLIALPYNFPASGNSIMNAQNPSQTGTTLINELNLNQRGFYFNSFDNLGVDRTSHYSQFTGQSVTITFTQNGDSAIYSGDSSSLRFWSGNTGNPASPIPGTGFAFGTQVNLPSGTAGNAILIQSATTTWVTGATVYVSVEINIPTTPTSTPTNTQTPTNTTTPTTTQTPTETPIPKFTVINNSTLDRSVTQIIGNGPWNLTTGSYPVGVGETAYGLTHPALITAGLDQLVIQFGGNLAINISITKNGSPYTASSNPSPNNFTGSQINYFINNPSDFIQSNDVIEITITDTF